MSEYIERVCMKLRETAKEFGQKSLDNAVIVDSRVSSGFDGTEIGGHKFVNLPTVSGPFLAEVEWKVSRFFEDVEAGNEQ